MAKVIIIGAGPAGVSASLYTIRAGIATTVISGGDTALNKADKIENYYGFSEPVSGPSLYQAGIDGAKRLGVEFIHEQVVGIGFEDSFVVETARNRYAADSVIIATGSQRPLPKIQNIRQFEGRGISYCAVCDAFFYRGKDVAVLGSGDYALHEAMELLPIARSVTLLTNGEEPTADIPDQLQVQTLPIASIDGEEQVKGATFTDGSTLAFDGLFIAHGIAGSTALAKKIGAITDNNRIQINDRCETNIPGLYAAGDCTGGLLQIAKAVYEGAKAGTEAVKYVRKLAK